MSKRSKRRRLMSEPVSVLGDDTMSDIINMIDELPEPCRTKLTAVMGVFMRSERCCAKMRKLVDNVSETFDQLRLDFTYLVFDLEATRRERDEYKKMLEWKGWREEGWDNKGWREEE